MMPSSIPTPHIVAVVGVADAGCSHCLRLLIEPATPGGPAILEKISPTTFAMEKMPRQTWVSDYAILNNGRSRVAIAAVSLAKMPSTGVIVEP